ncbi:MAG: GRP family sugar transporter [Duncaniella sp.]|nr:multidrug DMT transporter permease [Bacteroides sp.]MDE5827941.1 GRP family sugar transporter [Duncaniella sp.]MBD5300269.1 multidrug DMT transporter permease [Bacteroides sp.]MBD5318947.1 multidrug DMT transporter permease [Bacteroides sp.]MDE6062003.1 GRP family sugar transporter [Duncaniella sp.]
MILVHNYILAIICCCICCICWGSWANTQKLVATPKWRFELFYWDFTWGVFLTAALGALLLGGPVFIDNLTHLDLGSAGCAMLGGIVWNFANIFLTAAIAIAGMSVGFPIGGGLGWIGGIIFNYLLVILAGHTYPGNQALLWIGVAIIIVAIYLCAKAYGNLTSTRKQTPTKGIVLAVISGIGLIFFYGLVVKSLDPMYVNGGTGTLAPYTGVFFFALGVLISTPIFNTFVMHHPFDGPKLTFKDYLAGSSRTHLIGMLGGLIWMGGMVISFMGSGAANPAISYALSNAAPIVAMIWGVWIWKEFKGAPKGTYPLIGAMFLLFIVGLVLITMSNG